MLFTKSYCLDTKIKLLSKFYGLLCQFHFLCDISSECISSNILITSLGLFGRTRFVSKNFSIQRCLAPFLLQSSGNEFILGSAPAFISVSLIH